MPLNACGGVFCSCLLQLSRAMSSSSGAVSALIGLCSFAGPALCRQYDGRLKESFRTWPPALDDDHRATLRNHTKKTVLFGEAGAEPYKSETFTNIQG